MIFVQGKNKVDVNIGGQNYSLVGIESDEYMKRVASYVDEKMNEIARHNNKLSIPAAATLTAVNIADEFFKTKGIYEKLRDEIETIKEENEQLKEENKRLISENTTFSNNNASLHLELAKMNENEKSTQREVQQFTDRINLLIDEKEKLINENAFLTNTNNKLNIEIAKCTEEIIELRNMVEKSKFISGKR